MLAQTTLLVALFLSPAFAINVNVQLCNDDCSSCGDPVLVADNDSACLNNPDGASHSAFFKPTEDIAGADRWCTIWSEYVLTCQLHQANLY